MSKSPLTQNRPEAAFTRLGIRPALVAFGWLNVGLGMVGTILPIMPTTVFLLVALRSFSKSSPYFHDWLYTHPRFGPTLKAWRDERAIPGRAKAFALLMMTLSLAWIGASEVPVAVVLVVSAVLGVLALWIVTRTRPAPKTDTKQSTPGWRRAL